MRHITLSLTAGALMLLGCQSGASMTAPSSPVPTEVARESQLTLAGTWHLNIDGAGLAALVPIEPRQVAENDAVYELPINNFLRRDSLLVQSVTRESADRLDVRLRFEHPFRSSATLPRADLGVTGMVLLLADVPAAAGHTYFTLPAPVIANVELLDNAHGFIRPGGLLDRPDLTANTFPYRLLVDDGIADARLNSVTGAAISNGGNPAGNFAAPSGWQIGTTETWTGFDVLHQGQSCEISLDLDLGDFTDGAGSVDLALIVKYSDPKSATPGFEHRLPGNPADVLGEFGYRFPHGALDVSEAMPLAETGGLMSDVPSRTAFGLRIRDWDAHATETSETSLADEVDVTKVTAGASGEPRIDIGFASLLTGAHTINNAGAYLEDDRIYAGDEVADSGQPNDPLFYYVTVDGVATIPEQPGPRWGLLRVNDVEAGDQDYVIPLDGTLTPLTANLPEAVTYQAVELAVLDGDATGWARRNFSVNQDFNRDITVLSDGTTVYVGLADAPIDFGGGIRHPADGLGYIAAYDANGQWMWDHQFPADSFVFPGDVNEGPDGNVWVGGWYVGGNAEFGGGARPNAGSYDSFLAAFTPDGAYVSDFTFGGTGSDGGYCVPSATPGKALTIGFYQGPTTILGTATGNTAGFFAAGIDLTNPIADWIDIIPQATGAAFQIHDLSSGPDGDLYACGNFTSFIDLGVGALPVFGGLDSWAWHIENDGDIAWGRSFGGVGNDELVGVGIDAAGRPAYSGYFTNPADYGGGSRVPVGGWDAVVMQRGSDDSWLWDRTFGGPTSEIGFDIALTATEARVLIVTSGALNLGGGTHSSQTEDLAVLVLNANTGAFVRETWTTGTASVGGFFSRLAIAPDGGTRVLTGIAGTEDFDPGAGVFERSWTGTADSILWALDPTGGW